MLSPKTASGIACIALTLLLGACTTMSDDPRARTPGTVIDDQVIETLVRQDIRDADPGFDAANLNIVSYNGVVLLTGQVPNEQLKQLAGERARQIERVRAIHNEIEIAAPLSLVARGNDTWLTTKVKARMLQDEELVAGKIKVMTTNGVVYLMGLLPREEADRAVEVARTVYGVQKIVKVFEYL
ncbi:MAG: BON domain-containing protein [Pseudomonadales bacterium]|nr:BON domain-containing protein [Pseudomonadales bacterium]